MVFCFVSLKVIFFGGDHFLVIFLYPIERSLSFSCKIKTEQQVQNSYFVYFQLFLKGIVISYYDDYHDDDDKDDDNDDDDDKEEAEVDDGTHDDDANYITGIYPTTRSANYPKVYLLQ